MEKIEYEKGVFLYRTKITSDELKDEILNDVLTILKKTPPSKTDSYGYTIGSTSGDFQNEFNVVNSLFEILKISILESIQLLKTDKQQFNKINYDAWINVVKTVNPKQSNYRKNGMVYLHNHIDIQKRIESFNPTYTFVYYTQMPNNLSGNDGALIIGGKKDRYYFLPEVGDLIIMEGGLPHAPNLALKSTKDRIVIAGNIGFEYLKQKHSLI